MPSRNSRGAKRPMNQRPSSSRNLSRRGRRWPDDSPELVDSVVVWSLLVSSMFLSSHAAVACQPISRYLALSATYGWTRRGPEAG
jgi:hypothetical protein